ncbi:MAG: (Fe-S)-binding protein [Peptococcaceae bacterium]|nr:(Fe-S)-binding protein [Peptococcaceae bacterium]
MSLFGGLPGLEEELIRCMKCGNCQAVCPLYRETAAEPAVARGKVQLALAVLKGDLRPTAALARIFDFCLTCMACVANCPCGVRVDRIILAARGMMAKHVGLHLLKKTAIAGLSRPSLLNTGLGAARAAQGIVFRKQGDQMTPRFPLGLEMRRVLPALAGKFLRDSLPEVVKTGQAAGRVAFFTGCLINYVYPGTGRAIVNVLLRSGLDVIIPARQHCCGSPVTIMGDHETAAQMARSHVELFSSIPCDAVITACGTCGESFREYYPALLSGGHLGSTAKILAGRTFDICEYLAERVDIKPDRLGAVEKAVTYHQPCHLARGMGVGDQPVDLLKKIPGLKYVPLKDPGRCCGGSGIFSLTSYDAASRVRQHKLRDIEGTGADLLATGCGSCRMHIGDGLAREKSAVAVCHPVELLDESYRAGRKG